MRSSSNRLLSARDKGTITSEITLHHAQSGADDWVVECSGRPAERSRDRTRGRERLACGWRPRTLAVACVTPRYRLVLVDSGSSHTIVTPAHPNIAASLRAFNAPHIPQHSPNHS